MAAAYPFARAAVLLTLMAGCRIIEAQETVALHVDEAVSGNRESGGRLGSDFIVNHEIVIDALGAFDSGSDGFQLPITVELWSRDEAGTPGNPEDDSLLEFLASARFHLDDGNAIGGSRFLNLDRTLTLAPGAYTITALGYGMREPVYTQFTQDGRPDDAEGLHVTDNPALTFGRASRWDNPGPLRFPANLDSGPGNQYGAGTFSFTVKDSDDNGLPDTWEDRNGLDKHDPADASLDGDGDGFTTGEEFQMGTLPASPDSDGDGTHDGTEFPQTAGDGGDSAGARIVFSADAATILAQDRTQNSFESTVDLPEGRVAIGFICARAAAAVGDTISITVGSLGTIVHPIRDALAFAGAEIEDGIVIEVAAAGSYNLKWKRRLPFGQISGVVVRAPDKDTGIVIDAFNHAWSGPQACADSSGELVTLHSEMYTGKMFAVRDHDGVPAEVIDTYDDGEQDNYNDRYHHSGAVLALSSGDILFMRAGHGGAELQFVLAKGGNLKDLSPVRTFTEPGQTWTYCRACVDSSDVVWILTRASNAYPVLLKLANATQLSNSEAIVTRHVITTSGRPYPIHCSVHESGGTTVICMAWGVWTTTWKRVAAVLYDATNDQFHTLGGGIATNDDGARDFTTPAFSAWERTSVPSAGFYMTLSPDGHMDYGIACAFRIDSFAQPVKASACLLFSRTATVDYDEYRASSLYATTYNSSGNALSENRISSLVLPFGNTYRHQGALLALSGTKAHWLLTKRNPRLLVTPVDGRKVELYGDWNGPAAVLLYSPDTFAAKPAFTALQTISAAGNLGLGQFVSVPGRQIVTFDETVNMFHQTHAQAKPRKFVLGPVAAPVNKNSDTDGDGQSDLGEAVAGTDPNDSSDFLRILTIQPTQGGIEISWASREEKSYVIEFSEPRDGSFNDWRMIQSTPIPGSGLTTTFLVDGNRFPEGGVGYLRVRVLVP